MPRGYELNYFDSLRAMQRKIYSEEIKRFSSKLKQLGYYNQSIYEIVIKRINQGVYDNLEALFAQSHYKNKPSLMQGLNKSSREQDFMSPMELRLNSLAVKKATESLNVDLRKNLSVQDLCDLAYDAGIYATQLLFKLDLNKIEQQFSMSDPVLSSKPIVKKFNSSLVKGTWPKSETKIYKDKSEQLLEDLKLKNQDIFLDIIEILKSKNLSTQYQRRKVFELLNLGYYSLSESKMQNLEIASLVFIKGYNNLPNKYSITELSMNLIKLEKFKSNLLSKQNGKMNDVYVNAFNTGKMAREEVLLEYKVLPEMYPSFYEQYCRQQSSIQIKKDTLKNRNK